MWVLRLAGWEAFLSGLDIVYLFADAVYESLRQWARLKEGILVTRRILGDGSEEERTATLA